MQISSSPRQIKAIEFHARSGNTGNVFVGKDDVSSTNGRELRPGEVAPYSFGESSVPFSVFYVDAANSGDDVDWCVLLV